MSKTIAYGDITISNLTEPFSIILTNESQQFSTNENRVVVSAQSYYTDIVVYQGTQERKDFTIGNISNANGITVTKTTNRVTFNVSANTTITANNGSFSIPITLDGKTLFKTFSWACSKDGQKANSVSIMSNTQIFKSTDGGKTFSPDTIKLTPTFQGSISFSKWIYSTDGGNTWNNTISGNNGITLSSSTLIISKTSNLFSNNTASIVFRCLSTNSLYYGTITIAKLHDVTDLELGGTNLLLNTTSIMAYDSKINNWTLGNQNNVSINETDKSTDSRHIKTIGDGNQNNGLGSLISGISFKKGENYTFSCAIRGTYDGSKPFGCKIFYTNTSGALWVSTESTSWVDKVSNTIFKRLSYTFTIPNDFDEDKNRVIINIFCQTMDIYVRNFKLEKGTVATDWSPSPKDVQSQITSLSSTISGISSTVDNVNKKITDKVWQTDITDSVNNYDKSTANAIRDRVTKTESDISGINSSVSDMKTTLSKKADDSTVTELEKNVSNLQQSSTEFKSTVESTYAKREDLNNLKIGGKNYARKTSDSWSNWFTPAADVQNSTTTFSNVVLPTSKSIGDEFTISFDFEWTKFTSSSGKTLNAHFQGSVDNVWTIGNFLTSSLSSLTSDLLKSNGTKHFEKTVKISNDSQASATIFQIGFRVDYSDGTGKVRIKNLKVEIGNKSTDWTPAPEDTIDDITNLKTEIQQTSDRINLIVTSTSSSSSLTLTDNMISAITKQFKISSPDGKSTIVSGGKITTGSITTNLLASDAIKSNNYVAGSSGYSTKGSYLNLTDGTFYTPGMYIDTNGGCHVKGDITATSGTIGGCSIKDGKLQVPFANITGTLSASQICVDQDIVGNSGTINFSKGTFNYGDQFIWDGTNAQIGIWKILEDGIAIEHIYGVPVAGGNTPNAIYYSTWFGSSKIKLTWNEKIENTPYTFFEVNKDGVFCDKIMVGAQKKKGTVTNNIFNQDYEGTRECGCLIDSDGIATKQIEVSKKFVLQSDATFVASGAISMLGKLEIGDVAKKQIAGCITVDTILSSTSSNPIANKTVNSSISTIKTDLGKKSDSGHSHVQIQASDYAIRVGSKLTTPYMYSKNISTNVSSWAGINVKTYADRLNTISIGASSNMYGNMYLAGNLFTLGTYENTTSVNRPMTIGTDGRLWRYQASSSTLRLKTHIFKINYNDAKQLLNTNVYSFRYIDNGQPKTDKSSSAIDRYGFVLEDMEKTFPMGVEYDENGLPSSWCVQIIVPTMLEIIKNHEKEIAELKEKIANMQK